MSGKISNYAIHTCPHCGNEYPYKQEQVSVAQNELGTALEVLYKCQECGKEVVEVYEYNYYTSAKVSEGK